MIGKRFVDSRSISRQSASLPSTSRPCLRAWSNHRYRPIDMELFTAAIRTRQKTWHYARAAKRRWCRRRAKSGVAPNPRDPPRCIIKWLIISVKCIGNSGNNACT